MGFVSYLNPRFPIITDKLIRFYPSVIFLSNAGDSAFLVPSYALIRFNLSVASQNFIIILVISCEHPKTIIFINLVVKNQGIGCYNLNSDKVFSYNVPYYWGFVGYAYFYAWTLTILDSVTFNDITCVSTHANNTVMIVTNNVIKDLYFISLLCPWMDPS